MALASSFLNHKSYYNVWLNLTEKISLISKSTVKWNVIEQIELSATKQGQIRNATAMKKFLEHKIKL